MNLISQKSETLLFVTNNNGKPAIFKFKSWKITCIVGFLL
jgi:hypothetical protein